VNSALSNTDEGRSPTCALDGANEISLWQHVRDALRGLQFGTVTLIVQDGLVIQVDRTERKRLPRRADKR
jgi:hypothetical protein